MTLENIIGILENVKQRGEGYAYAKCPAHDDAGESLTLTVLTDGEVSLMCLNGCTEESIRGRIEAKNAPNDGDDAQTANDKRQSTRIIELALSITSDLWHTPEGDAYATMESESLLLTSREFQQSLEYQFYQREKTPATSKAINEALGVLSGKARIEGVQCEIHTRLAPHDRDFYLDLCDEKRRAVKMCADGWTIIKAKDAPVKFRRAKGMMQLPVPAAGGDAKLLRPFVNVASEEDFTLLLCWLVAALRADASKYPVLSLTGEQGSAKSTVTLFMRNLFDPNFAPLRNSLRNQWDAILAANNSFCIALNNLSDLPQELSDTLVCIADGAGFATRTHHSMTEETLFHTRRPIIANGISDIATRQDLLDRAICLHLPAIASSDRVSDDKLIADFEQARPLILGGLLNGVCAAMRELPNTKIEDAPRMAEFAAWGTAAESGLGLPRGAFMSAYRHNREAANAAALDDSLVASAIIAMMQNCKEYECTLPHLLELIRRETKQPELIKELPTTPRKLTAELKRCAPNLRAIGIEVVNKGREWNRQTQDRGTTTINILRKD